MPFPPQLVSVALLLRLAPPLCVPLHLPPSHPPRTLQPLCRDSHAQHCWQGPLGNLLSLRPPLLSTPPETWAMTSRQLCYLVLSCPFMMTCSEPWGAGQPPPPAERGALALDSARRGILASATARVMLGCLMAHLPACRSEVAHGCVSLGWTQQWTNCLSALHRGPVVPLLPVGEAAAMAQ